MSWNGTTRPSDWVRRDSHSRDNQIWCWSTLQSHRSEHYRCSSPVRIFFDGRTDRRWRHTSIFRSFPNRSTCLSSRFRSVPSSQVKAFRSSRLKRLHSSAIPKSDDETASERLPSRSLEVGSRRTFSTRSSLSPPSVLNRFRSLSTGNLPLSRRSSHLSSNIRSHPVRYSSPTKPTFLRTESLLPDIVEEEPDIPETSAALSQLSCTIVDARRPTANSCNVEELAAYLDNFLYLPKSLSGAAELMYT